MEVIVITGSVVCVGFVEMVVVMARMRFVFCLEGYRGIRWWGEERVFPTGWVLTRINMGWLPCGQWGLGRCVFLLTFLPEVTLLKASTKNLVDPANPSLPCLFILNLSVPLS